MLRYVVLVAFLLLAVGGLWQLSDPRFGGWFYFAAGMLLAISQLPVFYRD